MFSVPHKKEFGRVAGMAGGGLISGCRRRVLLEGGRYFYPVQYPSCIGPACLVVFRAAEKIVLLEAHRKCLPDARINKESAWRPEASFGQESAVPIAEAVAAEHADVYSNHLSFFIERKGPQCTA